MPDRHTSEPWQLVEPPAGYVQIIGGIDGDANDDGTLRQISTHVCDVIDNEQEAANASRILACVNACAGIPQDRLDAISREPSARVRLRMLALAADKAAAQAWRR